MVAGPEIARMLNEYDAKHSSKKTESDRHHEQIPSIQKAFAADVRNTTIALNEMGNPFAEQSTDLFTLDTKAIMSDDVVHAVRTVDDLVKPSTRGLSQNASQIFYNDSMSQSQRIIFLCSNLDHRNHLQKQSSHYET